VVQADDTLHHAHDVPSNASGNQRNKYNEKQELQQNEQSATLATNCNKTQNVLECAKYYRKIGLSVIPIVYKRKTSKIEWKEYQQRLPTEEELERWFSKPANVAIVTGKVSRNLVVIDFDSRELAAEFAKMVDERGSKGLRQALSNTWLVQTGKGFHIYVRLPDAKLVPRSKVILKNKDELKKEEEEKEEIDLKAEGGYVVAPPSIHPSGARYEFAVSEEGEIAGPPRAKEPIVLTEDEWNELLKLLELFAQLKRRQNSHQNEKHETTKSLRILKDDELLRLKELLSEAWIPGNRQFLALFFAGWAATAKVHPASVAKLYKMIAEEKNDDELNERLSTIYYTYLKYYGDSIHEELAEVDKLIEKWKEEGALKGSVSKGRGYEDKIKGKRGVQEILEEVLGEERALEVLREIGEVLGRASPYMDSIIEVLDYEKQLYAVANLRKLVIVRARRVKNGNTSRLLYGTRVFIGAPTRVTVYFNPLGGPAKFEVTWETQTRGKLPIGPATVEDILDRLKLEGLVLSKRLASDVLNAVLEAFIRKGKAEVRNEIEAPGFYWVEGELRAVKVEVKGISEDELREALLLLNELATEWYSHAVDRFATVLKWGLIAPFIYAMKQRGNWVPWLYLYGASGVGKSTLGEMVLKIWNLDSRFVKTGANIDTVPRLGYVLSQSTFPTLINEPGNAIKKDDIIEAMKNAIESTVTRGKFVKGSYTEIPSLSPLIMASNKVVPNDDALLRRLVVLTFTYGEKVSKERAREFEKEVKPKLKALSALGQWAASKILGAPDLLNKDWKELAEELLVSAYEEAGLEVPEWVREWHSNDEDIAEQMREQIREFLIKKFNEAYFRSVGRIMVETDDGLKVLDSSETDLATRVRVVLEKNLLEWAGLRDGNAYFTIGFVKEVQERIGDVGGLKGLAELLGWEYKLIKIDGKPRRVAVVSFERLLEFLA